MKLWFGRMHSLIKVLMVMIIILNLTGCGEKVVSQEVFEKLAARPKISGQISEVAPPVIIQELGHFLSAYQPQVSIITPQPEEVLQDNTVKARFQVKDLPIFKNSQLNLGPHLHVILDNQPYRAVYDVNQPLTFSDLAPGTHTLRVFASRPWHESFKNAGAYAQIKFHVFTKTEDNTPDPSLPLLTYSRPQGSYGAEPILLDFYLTNAPLPILAKDNPENPMADWRVRCTINGESFVLDRWQSVYLKGFKPGKNWIKLEFLDRQGNPVVNAFNSTTRTITYDADGQDTLAQIVRGELSVEQVRGIVDPNYTAKIPEPKTTEIPASVPSPQEMKPATPEETPTIVPQEESTSQQPVESIPPVNNVPSPTTVPPTPQEIKPPTPEETPAVAPQEKLTSESQPENQPIPQVTPVPSPSTNSQLPQEIKPPVLEETPTIVPQDN